MIESSSFLRKKYGTKNVLERDGDKVVVNHFDKVKKLLQIVSKMNKTIADKIMNFGNFESFRILSSISRDPAKKNHHFRKWMKLAVILQVLK